jgi:hypothetical protein
VVVLKDLQKDIVAALLIRLCILGLLEEDIYKAVSDNAALNSLPDFFSKGKEADYGPDEYSA